MGEIHFLESKASLYIFLIASVKSARTSSSCSSRNRRRPASDCEPVEEVVNAVGDEVEVSQDILLPFAPLVLRPLDLRELEDLLQDEESQDASYKKD